MATSEDPHPSNSDADAAETDVPVYQAFRAVDHPHPVRIPAVRHPSTGDYYVIWTDIADCFPRVVRIQHDDVYVPLMRDQDLYRIRPHGIKHHPGVVLEVVYGEPALHPRQQPVHRHRVIKKGRDGSSNDGNNNKSNSNSKNNNGGNNISNIHNNYPTHSNNSAGSAGSSKTHGSSSSGSAQGHGYSHSNGNGVGNENLSFDTAGSSSSIRSSGLSSPQEAAFSQDLAEGEHDELQEDEMDEKEEEELEEEHHHQRKDYDASQKFYEEEAVDDDDVDEYDDEQAESVAGKMTSDYMLLDAEGRLAVAKALIRQMDEGKVLQELELQLIGQLLAGEARRESMADPKRRLELVRSAVEMALENAAFQGEKRASLTKGATIEEIKQDPQSTEPQSRAQQQSKPQTTDAPQTTPLSVSAVNKLQESKSGALPASVNLARDSVYYSLAPGSREWLTASSIPPELFLRNEDPNIVTKFNVVRKRVSEILKKRHRWIEAAAPKLFIFLPATTTVKLEHQSEVDFIQCLTSRHFAVHFLCDCGNISGFETVFTTHLNLKDCPYGHGLIERIENDMVDQFGEYMVAILEALKYGVRLDAKDGGHTLLADPDPRLQERMTVAIKYLERCGVPTSDTYLKAPWTMESIPAVAPLTKSNLATIRAKFFFDQRRELDDTHPTLTPDRDVRWVCMLHCIAMSPSDAWTNAFRFSSDPASAVTEFRTSTGAFRVVITTRERARDYYQLAQMMTTTSALRLFLDFDLTAEDEEELRLAVAKFPAACVKLQVRAASSHSGGGVAGFGHGYSAIAFEAMKNKKIEAFVMEMGDKDEPSYYGHDERYDIQKSFSGRDVLVNFKRSFKSPGKLNLHLLVTDIDRALAKVRAVFRGLHNFTKLDLIIDDIWEYVKIRFIKPGQPGSEIEDTDYATSDMLTFFEKRGNMDSVIYHCRVMGDNRFIHCKMLTSLHLGYAHSRDRNKVRDALKNNKRLTNIQLENLIQDDPSQIYETFKSLMANHPVLNSFEIKQRHSRMSSDFNWRQMSDPTKSSLWITTYEGDKIGSMFQKYATSITTLQIWGITAQDVAVLEKVLRPKKGPFKLQSFSLFDVHLMEPVVLEDLKKIIIRGDFKETKLYGDLSRTKGDKEGEMDSERGDGNAKNKPKISDRIKLKMEQEAAAKTSDFIVAISSKITGFSMWGKDTTTLTEAFDARRPQAVVQPCLEVLSTYGMRRRLLDHKWLSEILFYKSAPFRKLLQESIAAKGTRNGNGNGNGNKAYLQVLDGSSSGNAKATKESAAISSTAYEAAAAMKLVPGALEMAAAAFESQQAIVGFENLALHEFEVQAEDWDLLLIAMDFTVLKTLRLEFVNEMTGAMMMKILDMIPDEGCTLRQCFLQIPGPTQEESSLCQRLLTQKLNPDGRIDNHAVVQVNGFMF